MSGILHRVRCAAKRRHAQVILFFFFTTQHESKHSEMVNFVKWIVGKIREKEIVSSSPNTTEFLPKDQDFVEVTNFDWRVN